MSEQSLQEIAELKAQIAFLEAAKAEADQGARKSDLQLAILLQSLVNKRKIYSVPHQEGREWEFLTKEEFQERYRGNGFLAGAMETVLPKKKAA